jgi:para-nitrobenzyl esterase
VRTTLVLVVIGLLAAASAASGGTRDPATTVAKPRGKAPLRYRDPVFSGVTVRRDIPYSGNLGMDIYEPRGDHARNRPAMVWIHGGGFRAGNKNQGNVVGLSRGFAQHGYAAVSIDYRLLAQGVVCGGAPAPPPQCGPAARAARDDAVAAVGWLRRHARGLRIDPNRIAVGGTSAGAVTSLAVATDLEAKVGAAVSISGWLPGGSVSYSRRDSPTLFFQGTADPVVPYDGAKATADAMATAGAPVVFETLSGAGHVPYRQYRSRFITHSAWWVGTELGLLRS